MIEGSSTELSGSIQLNTDDKVRAKKPFATTEQLDSSSNSYYSSVQHSISQANCSPIIPLRSSRDSKIEIIDQIQHQVNNQSDAKSSVKISSVSASDDDDFKELMKATRNIVGNIQTTIDFIND